MSGSFLVCAGLLLPLIQEPSLDLQQPSAMAAPESVSYSGMLDRLHDYRWMLELPREGEGVANHQLVVEAGNTERLKLEGPGVISHLWMSSQLGRVRLYVDGATEPTLDWDLSAFATEGMPSYLPYPLAMPLGLAWDTHLPLPFTKSMEVEFVAHADYGLTAQVDVRDLGKGVVFSSVSEADLVKASAEIERVATILREGKSPKTMIDPAPFKVGATRKQALNPETGAAGEYFWHFQGEGIVRWLELSFIHKENPAPVEEMLRGLMFRVEMGVAKPLDSGEVVFEVPLGDLFGSTLGANPFRSYMVGLDAETGTFHLRLPIPYQEGMKIVISSPFEKYARFGMRAGLDENQTEAAMPPMRLCAGWKRAREEGAAKGAGLKVDGPAHLAGFAMGATSPSLRPILHSGTFAFADYWSVPAPGAFQHVTRRDGPLGFGRNAMVRSFGLDAPSSSQALEFDPGITFPAGNGPTDYTTMAWFYAPLGTSHSMSQEYPLEQRVPPPLPEAEFLIAKGAMEAEEARGVQLSEGCGYEVKTVLDTSQRWSRLQFAHFSATKASDSFLMPFALGASGKYTLFAQFAKGEGYGQFEILIDGRVVGEPLDCSGEGLIPSGELELATLRMMARNDHTLSFRSLDGKPIGLDYVRIVPAVAKEKQ